MLADRIARTTSASSLTQLCSPAHVRPLLLHTLFEALAYVAAAIVYVRLRRSRGDVVETQLRLEVIAGAAVGAALGSRLLATFAEPPFTILNLMHGKTIVGGLLGGWIGVELAKRFAGITLRTGDLFAVPLATATAIGRIGCFLAGPVDHTAGLPSDLPWAIAMGDPVRRHPVALYEIAFLLLLMPLLMFVMRRGRDGETFRLYVVAYLLFRFFVDFLKPDPPPVVFGITLIQLASIVGALVAAVQLLPRRAPLPHSEVRPT